MTIRKSKFEIALLLIVSIVVYPLSPSLMAATSYHHNNKGTQSSSVGKFEFSKSIFEWDLPHELAQHKGVSSLSLTGKLGATQEHRELAGAIAGMLRSKAANTTLSLEQQKILYQLEIYSGYRIDHGTNQSINCGLPLVLGGLALGAVIYEILVVATVVVVAVALVAMVIEGWDDFVEDINWQIKQLWDQIKDLEWLRQNALEEGRYLDADELLGQIDALKEMIDDLLRQLHEYLHPGSGYIGMVDILGDFDPYGEYGLGSGGAGSVGGVGGP